MSRQVTRRELFQSHFTRMDGIQKHSYREQLPGENRDIARGRRVVVFESRKQRRQVARAISIGQFRKAAK